MADENVKHNMSLSELIEKHRHNGGSVSKHEFSDLWITDVGSPEGDLSGIIIKDSTFSGVDFANVTLTNAKLTNVAFEAASNLTIGCASSRGSGSSSKGAVGGQQLSLFGTSSATATVSAAPPAFDLSATMQTLRTLYTFDIRALIEESERRIREAQRKGNQYRPEQERFRRDLLDGYNRRCAITKMDDEDILQAAHIIPFCLLEKVGAGRFGNSRWNGILLRQELHTLFDRNTLTIAPLDGGVSLDSYYQGLSNHWEQFVLPPSSSEDPSRA